jgi:hypothetical protein
MRTNQYCFIVVLLSFALVATARQSSHRQELMVSDDNQCEAQECDSCVQESGCAWCPYFLNNFRGICLPNRCARLRYLATGLLRRMCAQIRLCGCGPCLAARRCEATRARLRWPTTRGLSRQICCGARRCRSTRFRARCRVKLPSDRSALWCLAPIPRRRRALAASL